MNKLIHISIDDYNTFINLSPSEQQQYLSKFINDNTNIDILENEVIFKNYIDKSVATDLFNYLEQNVRWSYLIKTRYGNNTRKTYRVDYNTELFNYINQYIKEIDGYNLGTIGGFYLNYYIDGNDYTPKHTHNGSNQLVLSLGGSRLFKISNKTYTLDNGDCIIFGDQPHEIPKQKSKCSPRISIATFYL